MRRLLSNFAGFSALLSLLLVAVPVVAEQPAGKVKSLRISPAKILIGGANRRQQLLITAVGQDGHTWDATRTAQLSIPDETIATLNGSLVSGVTDGKTQLQVRYGGVLLTVAITVSQFDRYPAVHFANDVVPIFSKLGCNSGGCHGKQSGQNGFRLSIFGSDTGADYIALVKAARGRRVFPAAPRRSLLIRKAIGQVPHGGGSRVNEKSPEVELLTQWVSQGMPWGTADSRTLARIDVEPKLQVASTNTEQQILATAHYSDGSRRDVTAAAAYASNAEEIAGVEQTGLIKTGNNAGEAAITVNYMGQVAAVQILVPRSNASRSYPKPAVNNRIDELVWAKLQKLGIEPSSLCDDATFLRRLQLDAIGMLPTPQEVRAFLADGDPNKRTKMIDAVLERDEFADYWALKWSDILLVNSEKLGERGSYEFHRWLRKQMATNRPYDQWASELITASGNSGKVGPVNFYRALRTPEDTARSVSQAFLGIRLDCAQCHHHPFEKWGQADFYGFSGFFNGLQFKKIGQNRELVYHGGYRNTKMPLSGEIVETKPLGAAPPAGLKDGDPRVELARWLTAADNPWFARLAANRLWKHYLGRGLVEPEDDLRSTNPATNEPLMAYLTEQVVTNNYDLKAVMRLILNSRVYQLAAETNVTNFDDRQNFSHHLIRRLPAEVLLDAISQVTGAPERFAGMPRGTRSIQLWDNRLPSYFLDTFGRSLRESPCECGKSSEPTMAQALHLMNAPEIEEKIARAGGRIARLIDSGASQQRIVDELCRAALGRGPSEKERKVADLLFSQQSRGQASEDFLWTLLNSYDFLFIR